MARTRRKMARPPRKRRPRDWVFRPNLYDNTGGLVDGNGSYVPGASVAVTAGVAGGNAVVLYDSANYRHYSTPRTSIVVPMPSWARAEGGRPYIHRVRGQLIWTPSSWALGDAVFAGARIVILEQDTVSGNVIVDPAYSMWAAATNLSFDATRFANDRNWFWERREFIDFAAGGQRLRHHWLVGASVRRRLQPHQCLALWYETAVGSVNSSLNIVCSSLVSDED